MDIVPQFFNRTLNKEFLNLDNTLVCDHIKVEIINGIPRFVNSKTYASLFGDQWKQYKKTQLDSYSGVPISGNRLNRLLGDLENDLNGRYVLEAGCGAGRFTEVLLNKGAVLVSSDISTAVEVNLENFPLSDRRLVIQADINDMPFKNETFDVVIGIGVIQHTPNPEQTIRDLFDLVKKGGTLIIDHYTFKLSYYLRLFPLYRIILKKLPSEVTIKKTKKMVKIFLPLHKKVAGMKALSVLLNRVSPVISYYDAFPQLNDKMQEEWAMLDTHDALTDWYKNFRSKRQIVATLKEIGGQNIWCQYGGNGVEARCTKIY
ncbi:MAG: class I SAM-dependent methyltransferase [Mucilaginibacter sp.]